MERVSFTGLAGDWDSYTLYVISYTSSFRRATYNVQRKTYYVISLLSDVSLITYKVSRKTSYPIMYSRTRSLLGKLDRPIRNSSALLAASRPSEIAQTTRD